MRNTYKNLSELQADQQRDVHFVSFVHGKTDPGNQWMTLRLATGPMWICQQREYSLPAGKRNRVFQHVDSDYNDCVIHAYQVGRNKHKHQ